MLFTFYCWFSLNFYINFSFLFFCLLVISRFNEFRYCQAGFSARLFGGGDKSVISGVPNIQLNTGSCFCFKVYFVSISGSPHVYSYCRFIVANRFVHNPVILMIFSTFYHEFMCHVEYFTWLIWSLIGLWRHGFDGIGEALSKNYPKYQNLLNTRMAFTSLTLTDTHTHREKLLNGKSPNKINYDRKYICVSILTVVSNEINT